MTEKKKTEADLLWDEISNKQISLFGSPTQKAGEVMERLEALPDTLTVRVKYPAVIAALDDILNVQRSNTSEKRVELFNIVQAQTGLVMITRVNPNKI